MQAQWLPPKWTKKKKKFRTNLMLKNSRFEWPKDLNIGNQCIRKTAQMTWTYFWSKTKRKWRPWRKKRDDWVWLIPNWCQLKSCRTHTCYHLRCISKLVPWDLAVVLVGKVVWGQNRDHGRGREQDQRYQPTENKMWMQKSKFRSQKRKKRAIWEFIKMRGMMQLEIRGTKSLIIWQKTLFHLTSLKRRKISLRFFERSMIIQNARCSIINRKL